MPDEVSANFEHAVEMDIRRLAEEVERHKEIRGVESPGDRELVKRAIQSALHEDDAASSAAPTPPPSANATVIQNPLPDYAASAPAETKLEIEYLLELAFKKGIFHASREARHSSAFVRDAFHDALAGKLYPILKERGTIQ